MAFRNLNKISTIVRSKSSLNYASLKQFSSTKLSFQQASTASSTPQNLIQPPNLNGQAKKYSPKIEQLVNDISSLNLAEVADLNELLRLKLNIKDVAMSYAAMPAAGQANAAQAEKKEEEEQEEAMPKAVKSSFRLKIVKFDEAKKVALIKEIKTLGENMNLVQAKKFIESLPQTFKDNVNKDEAEKLKSQLEKAGAVCEIE